MLREDALRLLAACPGHMEVFLGGLPVTGVDVSRATPDGHDVVAIPSTRRRDATGRLRGMKVRDLARRLAFHVDAGRLLVGGRPVDGLGVRAGRIRNDGNRRSFEPDPTDGRDVVVTFTRWIDLSDGTRRHMPV